MKPKRWLAVLAFLLAASPAAGAEDILGVLVEPANPTTRDRLRLTVVGTHNPYCGLVWEVPPVVDAASRTVFIAVGYPDCVTPPNVEEEFRHTFEIDPLAAPGDYTVVVGFPGASRGLVYERIRVDAPASFLSLGTGDDRFRIVAEWRNQRDGSRGVGYALPMAEDSGAFWFFSPDNLEATIKILDGRPVNGRWWVFIASMTDLEMKVTVYENRNDCFRLPVFPPACPSKTYLQTAGQNRNFVDVNFSAE